MPDPERLSEQARVFFALWPDARVRGELDRVAALLHRLRGGRRTRTETLHLTLVFVGSVARQRLPELQAGAAEIEVPAFELEFDRAECWPRNRIAFLTASKPPEPLLDLVHALERTLIRLGIPFDLRPYQAHVTLVRNADCRKTNPATDPILWPVRDFVLVESSLSPEGARYVQLARYPLR